MRGMQASSARLDALPGSPAQPFPQRLLLACRWSAAALDFLAMVSMRAVFACQIGGRRACRLGKQKQGCRLQPPRVLHLLAGAEAHWVDFVGSWGERIARPKDSPAAVPAAAAAAAPSDFPSVFPD